MENFTKTMQIIAIAFAPVVVYMALSEPIPNYNKATFFAFVGLANFMFYFNDK